MCKNLHRLRTVFRLPNIKAHLFEKRDQQDTAFLVVLGYQNPGNQLPGGQADYLLLPSFFPAVRLLALVGANLEAEGAAFTYPTGDGDVSAHHPRIIPADGHAQSRAPLVPFPRRCLLENLEDLVQFFCRDSRTGVLDLHNQVHFSKGFITGRHPQDYVARICKFYCIPQQIDQNLAKFILIRHYMAG
ncbi:MAG: hypothetical protein ACD_75C02619G0001 [uncultured bacterium]|nr:MAG: hypothetical protein ACD_75C02619G0001 [uncultured bacterium]